MNYEINDGKVYISKIDFNKVNGNCKKSNKYFGKNMMTILDPVSGKMHYDIPVVFKEGVKNGTSNNE